MNSINVYIASPGERSTREGAGDWVLITALSLKIESLSKSFIIPGLALYNEQCGLDDVLVRNIVIICSRNLL